VILLASKLGIAVVVFAGGTFLLTALSFVGITPGAIDFILGSDFDVKVSEVSTDADRQLEKFEVKIAGNKQVKDYS